jgi:hypothetical protein
MMKEVGPMTPRETRVLVVAFVACLCVGVVLFSGWVPGFRPNYTEPATVVLQGHTYYWTDTGVPYPTPPVNQSQPVVTLFHNVTFHLWVTGWYETVQGLVHGNASLPNGTVYWFVLGGPAYEANRSTLYLSPDFAFGASWNGQLFIQLYALVPP